MPRHTLPALLVTLLTILAAGCHATSNPPTPALKRPNILWLTSEDNNIGWVGCYGNPRAKTPNIDKLAAEGFLYENCFANAPVCSPSRSTWITGLHAISTGTHPMRSRRNIPHDKIKYYPDHLKDAGYYVSNCRKTDYNIGGRDDGDCWQGRDKFGWRKRKPGQPFFCIMNYGASHESRAQGDVENTKHNPANTRLRRYHPDRPAIRKNYAKYHDAVSNMDRQIGEALAQLEKDGLADDTIVIYCSDHGGVLPRSKRFLYESGIHCPLIVRIPEKFRHLWPAKKPGSRIKDIVSFIDMPKTWLTLAGAKIPGIMQGYIFLGPYKEERDLHFSWRTRMDERLDNVRAVRDSQFLYIKNYMPYAPAGQHLDYLWKMAATREWEKVFRAGQANAIQRRFFLPKPNVEELYDCHADPDNVHNLIDDPKYAKKIASMRKALRRWQLRVHDSALIPESDMDQRVKKHNTTVYEYVRDAKRYNLPAYLDAADVALAKDAKHLDALQRYLKNDDLGVRNWGAKGLFLLGKQAAPAKGSLLAALKDDSHEVRAMAAWALINLDDASVKKPAYACLEQLLDEKSYALLTVLNMIDWMGEKGKPLVAKAQSLQAKGYPKRMVEYLRKANANAEKR